MKDLLVWSRLTFGPIQPGSKPHVFLVFEFITESLKTLKTDKSDLIDLNWNIRVDWKGLLMSEMQLACFSLHISLVMMELYLLQILIFE
jgi:hypothetical protein